jgi:hypothetical protein
MTASDYHQILGLAPDASLNEIKKAYRQKARMYHPDINHAPEAKDRFILATEAYEFLIANHDVSAADDEAFRKAMDDWKKYRRDRSNARANAYARASYVKFRKTQFYRTTKILDGTSIIFSLFISVIVIIYTIAGYIYRLKHPLPDDLNPTVAEFVLLLMVGMVFFTVSVIYFKVFIDSSRKHRKKPKE